MLANLSVIHELISSAIPDRPAVIWGDRTITYGDLTARSRRWARALLALGLGCHTERSRLQPWESGQDHVALYLYNGPEFLEAMYGAYKARAVAVNVNYRYVENELHYVLANSRARAVVYHSTFAPRLAAIRARLPELRHLIQVADDSGQPLLDGAVDHEEFLSAQSAEPLPLTYSPDDLYVLYTGGTTGLPKGVLWRHEDVFFNGLGGHVPGFPRLDTEAKLIEHVNSGIGGRFLLCMPLMHGAGQWSAFNTFHRGGTVVLPDETRRLDAHAVWRAVERHRADMIGVVGDAIVRPLLEALAERDYDLSSMRGVTSTAAVLSPSVREALMRRLGPDAFLVESVGATEVGLQAMTYDTDSGHAGLPAYELRDGSVVLRNDRSGVLRPETARKGPDGEIGWIASTGHLPLGYLGDPERTRRIFPVIDGVRYAVTGDRVRYAEDGRILFLGREDACINTGGEKVYAEEVERVIKEHPAVYDVLVVGVPSERWGQEVTAVASPAAGSTLPTATELRAHCAPHLADYKIPKAIVAAPEIVRSPSGKPDYVWARGYAIARVGR